MNPIPPVATARPAIVASDPLGENNPLRAITFRLALAMVFLMVSMLNLVETALIGVNLRLLYIVGIPLILGTFAAGGFQRAFRFRTAYYWTGFALWMAVATAFSTWRGDSLSLLTSYFRIDLILLFVIAGLAVTWHECQQVMYAFAWGAVVNLLTVRIFASEVDYGGRLSLGMGLESGTVSNPNDFAGHLLLVLPFLYWIVLKSKVVVVRVAASFGVIYGIYVILKTASRGAEVALVVALLFILLRATSGQRIAIIAATPVLLGGLLIVVPQATWQRLLSFSTASGGGDAEANASTEARQYLLRTSIAYTLQFPIVGVGPGQFANYEGGHNRVIGTHGLWHSTHNTLTQVAVECGIPGFIFFLGGVVSTLLLLNRTFRQARARPDCMDIRVAVFCVMLGMIAFTTAILFLNFAYFFYLPAMAGLAISLAGAAQAEFASRSNPASQAPALALPGPGHIPAKTFRYSK